MRRWRDAAGLFEKRCPIAVVARRGGKDGGSITGAFRMAGALRLVAVKSVRRRDVRRAKVRFLAAAKLLRRLRLSASCRLPPRADSR